MPTTSTWRSVSSSRIRQLVFCILATGAIAHLSAAFAGAQGSVSGEISLLDRRGASKGDVRTGVIYLEPESPRAMNISSSELLSGTIVMRGREFIPHVKPVLAGGSVQFPNQDPFSHNVFSNGSLGAFDLGLYRRGTSKSAKFARVGVYPVYCNIHSKMVSFVVAVPSPWFAQPSANGRYVIPHVPAGRYMLHAWHERAGNEVVQEIEVPPTGISGLRSALDVTAFLDSPHLNKYGLPYTATRADRY